jgi:transcriptional regulator with XRE-family HTH domain
MQAVTDEQAKFHIASNLLRLRGDKSYSQIARECSTDEHTVYPAQIEKIEKAKHMPGVGLLSRIAEVLGVSVDAMLAPPSRGDRKKILEKIAG